MSEDQGQENTEVTEDDGLGDGALAEERPLEPTCSNPIEMVITEHDKMRTL